MSLRHILRRLPVFDRPLPAFAADAAPADPAALFGAWLAEAVTAGVVEPHAATMSTVDADGCPDARVLLLKDVDADGWYVAGSAASAKGRQLGAGAPAALTCYWREQGRQVRVRGWAAPVDRAASARDFRQRPLGSRVAGLAGRQSAPLSEPADLDRARSAAAERLRAEPDLVDPAHRLYRLRAQTVEFWQGDPERRHVRLRYRRAAGRWRRERLWP